MDKKEAIKIFKNTHIGEDKIYEALTLAIAALSDRGYEQGYKDGQNSMQNGHDYSNELVPESVTTATESPKCPICEHEMCFYVKDKRTSYCKCKCGHAYIWISGKLL